MKISVIILFALFLASCVNLNIKSEIPKIDAYDLNTSTSTSAQCEKYDKIALIGISSLELYDTKDIVSRSDSGKITSLSGKKWIDLPKNMFKDLLLQEASKKCILVSLPPFGTSMPKKSLKLAILSFVIVGDLEPKAQLRLSYEFFVDGKKSTGIFSNTQVSKDNPIKAFQDVSKATIDNLLKLLGS